MSENSAIEWTDATWNPVTGCSKVSAGCAHCYAETWARRHIGAFRDKNRKFTDVRTHADKLGFPLRWRKPRRIFVNSMSDLFHDDIPESFIEDVFETMGRAHWHTFQVLTKRPERMQWLLLRSQWWLRQPLRNVWLGVSVENQKAAEERIPLLLGTAAAVRFLSCEPLLGPVELGFRKAETGKRIESAAELSGIGDPQSGIHWVIAGGESGHGARPMHPDWVRALRDECGAAGVAFLFKQWGEWRPTTAPPIRGEYTGGDVFLRPDGVLGCQGDWWDGRAAALDRVGKKAAGRLLDGRTWDQFPEVKV